MLNFGASKPRVKGGARAPPLDPHLHTHHQRDRQKNGQTDKIYEISTVLYPRKRCHCRIFYLTFF